MRRNEIQLMLAQQTAIQADLSALRTDTGKALTRLEVIDARNKGADSLHLDQETRIRMLEASRWKLYGAAGVIATVISAGGTWVGILLTHH